MANLESALQPVRTLRYSGRARIRGSPHVVDSVFEEELPFCSGAAAIPPVPFTEGGMKRFASLFIAVVAAAIVGVIPVQASPGPGNSCPTGGYPFCNDYLNNTEASTVHMAGEQVMVNLAPFTLDSGVDRWANVVQFKTSDGTILQWQLCDGFDPCTLINGTYWYGPGMVPYVQKPTSTFLNPVPGPLPDIILYNPDASTNVTLSFKATGKTPSVVYSFYANLGSGDQLIDTYTSPTLSNWGYANAGKVGSFSVLCSTTTGCSTNQAFDSSDYTGTGGGVLTFNNTVKEWTGGQWVNWASSHVGPMDNGCGQGITTNCFQFAHPNAYTFSWNKLQ
jgi:hypothetical protein